LSYFLKEIDINSIMFSAIPIRVLLDNGHVSFVEVNVVITEGCATIELKPELANLAYEMGLNASKICENALKLAISRLQGVNMNNKMVDGPGFEPGTSTMPTWRSYQTDLPAHLSRHPKTLTRNLSL
jgi:hypothetical protein